MTISAAHCVIQTENMGETTTIVAILAVVCLGALYWLYTKGDLNHYLPVTWQHTTTTAATVPVVKSTYVSGGGSGLLMRNGVIVGQQM